MKLKIEKYLKKIQSNELLMAILLAAISFSSMCFQDFVLAYNIYSWLILFALVVIFYKALPKEVDKKYKKHVIIISFILSFLMLCGRILYTFKNNPYESFWRELFHLKSILYILGNFNILYVILINTIPPLCKLDIKKVVKATKLENKSKLVFWGSFIFILLGWLPYFLSYFPGVVSPDSISELSQISGLKALSDHHTIAHILFVSIPYSIGMKLFHKANFAVALASVTQMVIFAAIFSYFIKFLYDRKIKNWLLVLIAIYFSVMPIFGFHSITMWKDVLFSGFFLLFTIQVVKLYEKKEITLKNSISFIIISLLTVFFRNNAIYMYMVFAILALFFFKKYYKTLLIIFVIVFGIYYGVKGPVFDYFHILKSSSSEYIGMPLQQIGRMSYKNVKFTKEEKDLINKLMPIKDMKKSYNPEVSDGIKFNKKYNASVFDAHKLTYLKLWLKLVIKHPAVASEAYLISTLGYWYPGVFHGAIASEIYKNDLNIYMVPQGSAKVVTMTKKISDSNVPILSMIYSIGLCFWAIALSIYICVQRKGMKSLLVYVPIFGIWLTMLIASPAFAEYRYVLGAFTTLPLLLLYPFMPNERRIENVK